MIIFIKKDIFIMFFAERLQELRENRFITRKDLAAALNITISALGMYERGQREPNIDMLIRIADYFGVSVDFLVGRNFKNNDVKDILSALKLKDDINSLPLEYKELIEFMLNKVQKK
jgi:transcriptional regulator with XRE-family HTH domain